MTEAMLMEVVKRLPPNKVQEVYDFARFLAEPQAAPKPSTDNGRIAGFESEGEMIDYINDIGKLVYAD